METKPICQSCAMPMSPEEYGTNADASANSEYCKYCFENGAFTSEQTMDEMIETCIPFMKEEGSEWTEDQIRAHLREQFKDLKRWAQ